jgi:hypothetical protein
LRAQIELPIRRTREPSGTRTGGSTGSRTLFEHWDGTSWSIITNPSGVFGMDGVTALSDGTVVIVSSSGAILEN